MLSKPVQANRPSAPRRGREFACLGRFGGNGTLNFHIAEDAVLPPALQSKLTLVA